MVKTDDIFDAFAETSIHPKSNSSKSLSYEKGNLYSYNELIAYTDLITGEFIVLNKTAKGNCFCSMTTSCHIGKICEYLKDANTPYELKDPEDC